MKRKQSPQKQTSLPATGGAVYSYLRVSTIDQNTEKFKNDVLRFANDRKLGNVEFTEEKVTGKKSWKKRELYKLVEKMNSGDVLIVPELSRLGRSLIDVLECLEVLKQKQCKCYSVKENFHLNGDDMQSTMMSTLLALFAKIERDLISQRTKEGLQAAKERGTKLGRPVGSSSSKLDQYHDEIVQMIKQGVGRSAIAHKFKVTPVGLWYWLKKENLINLQPDWKTDVLPGKSKQ